MTTITQQYMQYIELLEKHRIELAADYLAMAALLIEIKSRLLLPANPSSDEEVEEDPRMELVRRLQAYEQFKEAALSLDGLPRLERDLFLVKVSNDGVLIEKSYPEVSLQSLVEIMNELLARQQLVIHHTISREPLSVNERMTWVLNRLAQLKAAEFTQLLSFHEGRAGLVVTLLAILELARQSLLTITQASFHSRIHLQVNYDG
jgi:segregation and condensation protein A